MTNFPLLLLALYTTRLGPVGRPRRTASEVAMDDTMCAAVRRAARRVRPDLDLLRRTR